MSKFQIAEMLRAYTAARQSRAAYRKGRLPAARILIMGAAVSFGLANRPAEVRRAMAIYHQLARARA